jgi:hypothetical protein
MRFRNMRIAWSVAWGVLAALVVVLWVRSYFAGDAIRHDRKSRVYVVSSSGGVVAIVRNIDSFRNIGEDNAAVAKRSVNYIMRRTHSAMGIDGHTDGLIAGIVVSHWVLVLASFIAAALPWLVRGDLRFSLRTLLIVVALVAVALALMAGVYRIFSFRRP